MGLTLAVFGWQPLRSSQPDLVLGVQLMTLEHYSGHLFSDHRQGPLGAWPATLADQAPPHSRWHFQPPEVCLGSCVVSSLGSLHVSGPWPKAHLA